MAVKLRLKKGDQVIVTTGRHRGKRGEILEVIRGDRPGDHRVVVGGVNKVKRHTRPSQKSPGGIIEKVRAASPGTGTGSKTSVVSLPATTASAASCTHHSTSS